MAEERNLGLARAPETSDDADSTKAELQRRMDEARESISQTVTEIKDTVVNQYQQVRETISDTLDWREQFKRRPLPFTIGAAGVGFLVGYTIMGAFKADDEDEDYARGEDDERVGTSRSYAASPIIGQPRASSAYQRISNESSEVSGAGSSVDTGADARPSYSSGYQASNASSTSHAEAADEEEEEEKGPGLLSRFKETKAYDKLTDELSTLGERAVEELSRTAQAVVVPLLLNKLKSLIGLDLSTQQGTQRGAIGQQSARTQAGTSTPAGERASDQGASSGTANSSAYTATGGTGQS
jgi:ElaB/YqjD/DUF883 family membrane-anchored ribosome-binding protein